MLNSLPIAVSSPFYLFSSYKPFSGLFFLFPLGLSLCQFVCLSPTFSLSHLLSLSLFLFLYLSLSLSLLRTQTTPTDPRPNFLLAAKDVETEKKKKKKRWRRKPPKVERWSSLPPLTDNKPENLVSFKRYRSIFSAKPQLTVVCIIIIYWIAALRSQSPNFPREVASCSANGFALEIISRKASQFLNNAVTFPRISTESWLRGLLLSQRPFMALLNLLPRLVIHSQAHTHTHKLTHTSLCTHAH